MNAGQADTAQANPGAPNRAARIIAIGSGKGGVGRTVLAANIGTYLAQLGKNVVLVDADFSGANLHTVLGLDVPGKTLSDVLLRQRESLADIVVQSPVPGLGLISGAGDLAGLGAPKSGERDRFLQMLGQLAVDFVIVDLKSGTTGEDVLDLFLVADLGVVVVVPEPTAIENSYRFIKSAFFRRIWNLERYKSLRGLLEDAQGSVHEFGFMSPPRFLVEVRKRFPDLANPLVHEIETFNPQILVNRCRTIADHELGKEMVGALRRKLHIDVGCLGHVERDEAVHLSVCRRRPLLLDHHESKVARDIQDLTRNLLATEMGRRRRRSGPA